MSYKKGFFGLVGVIMLVLLAVLFVVPAVAQPVSYTYQIQVTQSGVPVADAVVRIAGVGVEMTNAEGIAVFDLSDAYGRGGGRQQLFRGPNYANKKGKMSGSVSDEYDLKNITISSHDIGEQPTEGESSFAYGTQVYLRFNQLYIIEL